MTDRTPSDNAAIPTLAQLQETRLKRWHQTGEALLTFENVRSWLNAAGLVLFVPRAQIAAPAPSMAEAVLGSTNASPTLQETAEARSLLARMISEGIAVPLNLLGTQGGAVGETPDFVASAAVFSYIFTLRGDKGWKQPPSTSGPNKVSQLAVHAYEILAKSGSRSASDLTQELGSGVTEAAVLRALAELWTHLRVLPMPQQDGRATLWELTSTRYIKQIKAGANAGQPSALSALISLYLGQVAVATEDDVEVFLSPLAPRSRVRDVIHALTAARQLDTVAIEGRTMVHLAGEAPSVPAGAPSGEAGEEIEVAADIAEQPAGDASESGEAAEGEGAPRIKKFVPKPKKIGTGYLAKGAPAKGAGRTFGKAPEKRAGRGERPAFGRSERGERPAGGRPDRKPRPAFGRPERSERPGGFAGKPDRERRPFQRSRPAAGDEQRPERGDQKPRFDRPWSEDRPQKAPRFDRGERPSFAGSRDASARPRPRREGSGGTGDQGWKPAFRGTKRPEREGSREQGDRPQRREGGGGYAGRGAGASRSGPARFGQSAGGPKRPFRRAEGAPQEGRSEGERPARPSFRKFDAPRPGSRPPFAKRREGGGAEERPRRQFSPRPEGGGGARPPRGEGRPREFNSDRRPSKFASKRTGPPREGGFSARPRPSGPRTDRPYGNKGPSRKSPAKRTFKRREDESA